MTHDSVVQRTQSPDFSRLDDAYLAIDAQKGYCYSLNGTAGKIWDMLDEPISLTVVCSRLQKEYAVDAETCHAEVVALAVTLEKAGLLQVVV